MHEACAAGAELRLPRLHPFLGAVSEGSLDCAAAHLQDPVCSRPQGPQGAVPQNAAPHPERATRSDVPDAARPLQLLRHHGQQRCARALSLRCSSLLGTVLGSTESTALRLAALSAAARTLPTAAAQASSQRRPERTCDLTSRMRESRTSGSVGAPGGNPRGDPAKRTSCAARSLT